MPPPDLRKQLRKLLHVALLALVLGLASGYVIFYSLFPIASVPATSDTSLPLVLAVLALSSVIVGLASEDLVQLIFECFVGLVLSGGIASAIALSPSLAGVVFIAPDSVPAYVIHYGFLLFLLTFVADIVGGTIGLALRERYFYRGAHASPAPWERK